MKKDKRLIVALDIDKKEKALHLVDMLSPEVAVFKVGLELFSSCGPDIVADIRKRGCEVFLDLKFHDIPNTAGRAAASVTGLGAFMFNVHALGGFEMMQRAAKDTRHKAETLEIPRPKILAVTMLTSMDRDALKRIGIEGNVEAQVLKLAKLAHEAGLDGVVASPKEAFAIRRELGKDFIIVTPGIRPSGAADQGASDDQKRIATPKDALSAGADYIVVGRPITEAADPLKAAREILKEIIVAHL